MDIVASIIKALFGSKADKDRKQIEPYLEKIGVKCPKCGKEIVLRRSSKGRKFYSCEGYPDCDFVSWKRPEAPKEQTETAGEAVKD